MSRAFVKEPDGDQVGDTQPDLPISKHTNYVTPNGLKQLTDKRDELLSQKSALSESDDITSKTQLTQVERELRYFNARITSAVVVTNKEHDKSLVAIGATVSFVDEHDKTYRFTIVGEDEASLKEGKISWISPLAKALTGKKKGDAVTWKRPIGDLSVTINDISY